MAISVKKLKGMNTNLESRLTKLGIRNSLQLLDASKGPSERKALSKQVGVDEREILELANRADLSRIKGIAGVYSDLLEKAGVDTVKELATRRPDNLHAKLLEVNNRVKLSGREPTLSMVNDWINQAKSLPKMLSY